MAGGGWEAEGGWMVGKYDFNENPFVKFDLNFAIGVFNKLRC